MLRLNKYIATNYGVSRREADELINAGKVLVNNKPAEIGARVEESDEVIVDGKSEYISTLGGIFQVKENHALILADEAEKGSDIDVPRAKLAKERAEARLGNAKDKKERARAERAIAGAMARLKAADIKI